ncbi:MAG TPA: biotin--[acetyl-CoA-carboxylase] ligase [Povalibacter sp.]|nr:biotin--[acetyl-CoA-carboxylase] ligase [Povalibacter sp.]
MPAKPKSQAQVRRQRLLALLANGAFHSGERLAKRLRISRGGVWKLVRTLRGLGIEIESVARQGYRLPRAVDLLTKEALLDAMSPAAQSLLDRVDVLLSVDSTNRHVYDNLDLAPGHAQLCIAELQNAGRGRRGRTWVAPFGSGICMSIGWQFQEAPPTFSALSLAVGVAVVKALRRFGAEGVGLKWPNDLIWQGRKLGGILIEMRGESGGPSQVVIGIGLNTLMSSTVRLALAEQQAALIADVHEILRDRAPTRSALAGAVTEEIIELLQVFATRGFEPFVDEWRQLDTLAHAPVKVINGAETIVGTAQGVEVDGALLVDVDGQLRRFVSGEVSLRAR